MGEITRKQWKGCYISYTSSHDGTATFQVSMRRTNNRGRDEWMYIDLELDRSNISCIVRAMKAFADKEREQVGGLPL